MVLAAALLTAACGDDGPARDPEGNITDTGAASVFSFRTGDCFDDPASDAAEVEELSAVPCSQPHDNEIYHTFDMPDGEFPGAEAIFDVAYEECLGDVFTGYVGITFEESELDVFPVTPTETSWGAGDRTVYCAVFNLDLSKITGSVRGTGR